MPTPPANRKVLHYFGYFYPILFMALGAAGLIMAPFGRTLEGSIVVGLLGAAVFTLGGFLAWRHSKQDTTAPVTLEDYPLSEQPRQLHRYMWITGVGTALAGDVGGGGPLRRRRGPPARRLVRDLRPAAERHR